MRFTAKDPRCADVLARLDLARRGMKQTLLTGKPYKPAAAHMAPPKPHVPATVMNLKTRRSA